MMEGVLMKTPRRLQYALVIGFFASLVAAKCGGKPDTAGLLSGGEVTSDSAAFRALDYPITSDNYRKWLQAQSALDSVDVDPKLRISPRKLTGPDIDRVIETLEARPAARAAIESSGLSVRDYVLTTIALAQSWDAVNRPRADLTGIPSENIEWMRRQAADDPVVRERPRARILDDDSDTDSEDSDDSDRKRRKHRNGRDSDSDS